MSRRHVSRFVVVNETLLYRYITLHYRVCEREKKKTPGGGLWRATKTSKETPFPLSFLVSFPSLFSPLLVPDSLESGGTRIDNTIHGVMQIPVHLTFLVT